MFVIVRPVLRNKMIFVISALSSIELSILLIERDKKKFSITEGDPRHEKMSDQKTENKLVENNQG